MKLVKTRLAKLLVIMVTMLPLAGVSAAEEFMKSGLITRIDAGTVKLYLYDDIKFRFKTSLSRKGRKAFKIPRFHFRKLGKRRPEHFRGSGVGFFNDDGRIGRFHRMKFWMI